MPALTPLTRLLQLARAFRPELSPKEIRQLMESAKGEAAAWNKADFNAAEMWADKRNPLLNKLFIDGVEPWARKHNEGINKQVDDMVELFRTT